MSVIRTPRVANPHVIELSPPSGQYLHFRVETHGLIGLFAFATSARGVRFEADDFLGHPRRAYEWDHLRNPADVRPAEHLDLDLAFIAPGRYRYTVELRTLDGGGATLLDMSFSGEPGDRCVESLTVLAQPQQRANAGRDVIAGRLRAPRPGRAGDRSSPWWLAPSVPSS